MQAERFAGIPCLSNARIPPGLLSTLAPIQGAARGMLVAAASRLRLSTRGLDRVVRVARTIADFEGRPRIGERDLAESLSYRALDETGVTDGH